MYETRQSVRRPFLYVVAALFAIALAVPMAVSSGQASNGGIFDECFGAGCSNAAVYASTK
jgi:hypothetical protein